MLTDRLQRDYEREERADKRRLSISFASSTEPPVCLSRLGRLSRLLPIAVESTLPVIYGARIN